MKQDIPADREPQDPGLDSPPRSSLGAGFLDDDIVQPKGGGIRWILGSGLLLLLALGAWFAYRTGLHPEPKPLAVATLGAEVADVEVTVTGSGVVELGGQQTFKAPTDVTVEAVPVQERQRVSRGEVLLVLRDRNLQQQLNQALVEMQQAQNTFNRERERIQERQARLTRAQERLGESQALLDQGFISEDDYRQDQNEVEDAQSLVRDAEVTLANAELDLRNQQLQVQNLRARIADTRIVAPFDAVVLNIDVNSGDGVQQEGQLMTIGDPTQETVRLQLLTLDALRVRLNMPVRVSMIGPNAQTFAGRVADISPQAVMNSPGNSGRNQPTTVEAQVVLNTPSQRLIPGSEVSVEIILDQRRDAVTVPITAVQLDGAQPYVWVQDAAGTAQKRPVTPGLQGMERVEIRTGLGAGDIVIPVLPSDVPLTPGTPLISPDAPIDGDRPPTP